MITKSQMTLFKALWNKSNKGPFATPAAAAKGYMDELANIIRVNRPHGLTEIDKEVRIKGIVWRSQIRKQEECDHSYWAYGSESTGEDHELNCEYCGHKRRCLECGDEFVDCNHAGEEFFGEAE